MTVIFKVIIFLLGMYLSMRMIAALYGVIDLWYTMKTAYIRVIREILIFGIITFCLIILLGQYQKAFLWGFGVYILFYLFSYVPSRLRLIMEMRSGDIE